MLSRVPIKDHIVHKSFCRSFGKSSILPARRRPLWRSSRAPNSHLFNLAGTRAGTYLTSLPYASPALLYPRCHTRAGHLFILVAIREPGTYLSSLPYASHHLSVANDHTVHKTISKRYYLAVFRVVIHKHFFKLAVSHEPEAMSTQSTRQLLETCCLAVFRIDIRLTII